MNVPLGLTTVTSRARNAVRAVFKAHARPPLLALSTQDIYHLTHEDLRNSSSSVHADIPENTIPKSPVQLRLQKLGRSLKLINATTSTAPYPDHPIVSMRYLKKFVLEDMVAAGEIEKVYARSRGTTVEGKFDCIIKAPGCEPRPLLSEVGFPKGGTWLWRIRPPEQPRQPTPAPEPAGRAARRKSRIYINKAEKMGRAMTGGGGAAGAPTTVPEEMPEVEMEDESRGIQVLELRHLEKDRLRFVDVPDIDARYPWKYGHTS